MALTDFKTDDLLCFSLYSASHAMSRIYRPLLDPLGLTYPQYLVLVSLWDKDGQRVSELGETIALESNTLTPLLKRMESAGLVTRTRSTGDERVLVVTLTDKGRALQSEAAGIAGCVLEATGMTVAEIEALRGQITRLRLNLDAAATAERRAS